MVISTEASPAMSMTSDVRMRQLHANRGRQAVAHGAESARRHPAVWLLEPEELRRPHLVLADLGGDVDVAVLVSGVEPLDGVLRLDDLGRWPIGEANCARASVDLRPTRPAAPRLSGSARSRLPLARSCRRARCAQSPTMPISTCTFLLIDDGSMSMWIFFEPGEKASSRPVMRSSNRAPTQTITSQSCIARFAS